MKLINLKFNLYKFSLQFLWALINSPHQLCFNKFTHFFLNNLLMLSLSGFKKKTIFYIFFYKLKGLNSMFIARSFALFHLKIKITQEIQEVLLWNINCCKWKKKIKNIRSRLFLLLNLKKWLKRKIEWK